MHRELFVGVLGDGMPLAIELRAEEEPSALARALSSASSAPSVCSLSAVPIGPEIDAPACSSESSPASRRSDPSAPAPPPRVTRLIAPATALDPKK